MDIKKIKAEEMSDIRDFCDSIDEYGHIYHFPADRLDGPFEKIMEGIAEVQKLMNE